MTIIQTHILSGSPLRGVLCAAIMLLFAVAGTQAADYAGATIDKATAINDTVELLVQDGGNYIKIEPYHLPATICYLPDSAFGPIPAAVMAAGDTLPSVLQLADCQMQWQWEIAESTDAKTIQIAAKENARIVVYPYMCHATYSDTTAVVCGGMEWGGQWLAQSGVYTQTLTNASGCDSVRTLHLTINNATYSDTTAVVCGGMEWGGEWLAQSGDYTQTLTNANGCDSVRTLHLTVNNATYSDTTAVVCGGMEWGGEWLAQSGDYIQTLTNASGCDSVRTLHLTVNNATYSDTTAVVCGGLEWGGEWLAQSGDYTQTLTNASGCDSVRTLHLTVNNAIPTDTTATAWDSFAWYGKTFAQSGDYTVEKTDANGCDYIHTLHLTIHTTSTSYEQVYACDSMEVNGEMVTTSGEWLIDTTYTQEGNRVVNYLVVTMGETYYGTSTLTACNQFESASGKIYTESGTYTDTIPQFDGCEAIVTYYLTIEECDGSDDEAVEDILVTKQAEKRIENGQLYIIRKEEKYTILGNKIQ